MYINSFRQIRHAHINFVRKNGIKQNGMTPKLDIIILLSLLAISCSTSTKEPNLHVGVAFEWFESQTPDFIQQTAIAPDVTGSGVFLAV